MATVSFDYEGSGSGLVPVYGSATLTYSTSTTNTAVTVSVSKIQITNDDDVTRTFSYSVSIGGTTVASGSKSVAAGATASVTLSGSKSFDRGHSATTATVRASGSTSGGSGAASATVSVAERPSYSVTYSANSGSGAPSTQTKWYNESLTLSSTKPTRTNYEFRHWNTSTSDTGTAYDPGDTYTGNANLALKAIWNPLIQYNANGSNVGGMPVTQVKTYGVPINLSSNVPSRAGYQFDGWYGNSSGTGTKCTPGESYNANIALTLYAKWLKVPDAPRITSMSVVRCDSSGTSDNEGTYCKVTTAWSVDTTSDTVPSNTGTVTGTIRADGSSTTRSITWSSGSSGTSGTAIAIVSGCDVDTQYLVTVTVTDAAPASTSRTDVLTRAKFVLDFRAGGGAMGIGSAAPQSGLEVGWDAQFDGDVDILGDIEANNLKLRSSSTVTDIISAYGNWTIRSANAHLWGRLCHLYLYVYNSAALTAGTEYRVGTLKAAYKPRSYMTFGCENGGGCVDTSGNVYFVPSVNVNANILLRIGSVYFV